MTAPGEQPRTCAHCGKPFRGAPTERFCRAACGYEARKAEDAAEHARRVAAWQAGQGEATT